MIRYKLKFLKECRSITFARLFTSYVCPISDYGAGVWGTKLFGVFEQIQRRAIRYLWGLHRVTPVDMLQGDMDWISCYTRHNLRVLRLWNRLVMLEANRLTCKIFLWDQAFAHLRNTWSGNVSAILRSIGMETCFTDLEPCDIFFFFFFY